MDVPGCARAEDKAYAETEARDRGRAAPSEM